MNCEPEDTVAAEGRNQAHEQRSGGETPGNPNPELPSDGVAHRDTIVNKPAALDAGHNPGGDQRLDERLQFVGDGAYRIKERPLLEMEDLWNDPVRQESESHEDANENEKAPTGAQAMGVEEDCSHIEISHIKRTVVRRISFPLKPSCEAVSRPRSMVRNVFGVS